MKALRACTIVSVLVVFALLLVAGNQTGHAQDNQPGEIKGGGGPGEMIPTITYQGMLKDFSAPISGTCDFKFSLWDSSTSGIQIGATEELTGVSVSSGLFTVTLNSSNLFGSAAFSGALRWLEIAVRCPTGAGSYTTLTPRQWITAVPYAAGLVPGVKVEGTDYQILKVVSDSTQTSNPAAVTGEVYNSMDGVGVYGGYYLTTTGSTGMGIWGRTYADNGVGVMGTGYYGSSGVEGWSDSGKGVYAYTQNSTGVYNAALYAENGNTGASTPAGIAIFGINHSADASIVARNTGPGDTYRAINQDNSAVVFRVTNTGHIYTSGVNSTGADLAESFSISTNAPEPGTLMVIDPDHPGQLKPSSSAYDPLVAGIVSGAGDLQPGVTLSDQEGVAIALAGRVYVKAEAFSGAIHPGDLLTTSSMPGLAMKATDRLLAQGAIIGKAMTGLESGTGLVLVLVSLQ